jgi:hypothetical protein
MELKRRFDGPKIHAFCGYSEGIFHFLTDNFKGYLNGFEVEKFLVADKGYSE